RATATTQQRPWGSCTRRRGPGTAEDRGDYRLLSSSWLKRKHLEEIANRGHVERHIGVTTRYQRIRQIVAAAGGQRRKVPVALDELQHRDVVIIRVHHPAALGIGGHHQEGNARTVAEEIERLREPGIPVAATLVEGDEQGGLLPEMALRLEAVEDFVQHGFEEIELGAGRVPIEEAVRFDESDCRQLSRLQVGEEIDDILD